MKKYNLFKVLAITVFVCWLLTLFIPGSYIDYYTGATVSNGISGVGVWGLLSNLSVSIAYFNGIAVFLIALACFYAVLNKTESYNAFVSKVALLFKGKEKLLVVITTLVFGILALFVSDFLILLVFAPFVYKVMKELSIDKKIILSSTLVASLIGSMCGIYNSTLFTAFNLELNTMLLVKVILFVVSIAVLIILTAPKNQVKETVKKTVSKTGKKMAKEEEKTKPVKKVTSKSAEKKVNKAVYATLTILLGTIGINKFYAGKVKSGILSILFCWTGIPTILSIAEFITVLTEKKDKNGKVSATSERRRNVSFVVSLVIFTLFVIGSVIPWESLIEDCTVFSDLNAWISDLSIGNYAVFNNIIGAPVAMDQTLGTSSGIISTYGSWVMTDIAILLFILTVIIGVINNIKINDFIATVTSGTKKILPVAITAMLISIVLVIMVTTGINVTITDAILSLTEGFNIATATLATMVGSVLTADFYYLISTVGTVFSVVVSNQDYFGVVALIIQSIYNLMMIIAPTSVGLIIGLYYLDIPYNKWFKFIWKLLLVLLIIIIITSIVIYVLI
jgi:uncharacterized ion transporter superfamily protein YfcC